MTASLAHSNLPKSNPAFRKQVDGKATARIPFLHGNEGMISDVRTLTPCYLDTPVEELRKRYWEDGVLWVKSLLNPHMVNKFRGDYFAMLSEGTKMLKAGSDPQDGIFNPDADWREYLLGGVRVAAGIPNEGPFVGKAYKAHHLQTYVDFKEKIGCQMEDFVGQLTGFDEPWCLPRSLLRFAVPGGDTTPVHYDQIFLRAGPPTSITAWAPLGDIEIDGGGLIYLDKAHDIGVQYEEDFRIKNSELSDEERLSAFNKNMMKGGWLDKNAARFGEQYKRAWLIVRVCLRAFFQNAQSIRARRELFFANQHSRDGMKLATLFFIPLSPYTLERRTGRPQGGFGFPQT